MAGRYTRLSALDIETLWSRWVRGDTAVQISTVLGCHSATVAWHVGRTGGLRPAPRRRAPWTLTLAEREEISRGVAAGDGVRVLARRLGRAPSTISRELARHGGPGVYRASDADATAWACARRPKRCRLVTARRLRRVVERKPTADWSPQQIAVWLRRTYPDDPTMQLSHETIYRALYVQARGALKRELVAHLRRGQRVRRPRAQASAARGPGQLVDIISIAERPASADDRAVPGHWEGDLLIGKRGTQIATLVERQSRFVMLVRIPTFNSATVVDAVARRIIRLPAALQQSLTWDRGKEMAQHRRFTVETGVQIYFCDPQSPWQRGSNENTNGLLRQYFPKGADLSTVTQRQLDAVALKLNTRPRHTLDWETPAAVFAATVATTG
ncbi:MAG: IS30 family transposase [Polaromonas sp.]|nr:IS30 family transposase [Gemmatimonadaceae bacterium]